jgi:transposase
MLSYGNPIEKDFMMAYRYGNRRQTMLFPQSIDEYVPSDAPVRAYDVFVDALDLEALGIGLDPGKVGCPQYDPTVMLKLLLYGYSYGVRSSRKLERETHYNVSFMWLMGGLKPDFKTISEFRRNHKAALANVLKQCARLCLKLGLIEGNTLFTDGSKIRANAGIANTWDEDRCAKRLEKIDARIGEILNECEQADRDEADEASLVKLKEELADNEKLRVKVADILDTLQAQDKKSINATDPDCTKIKGRQGSHAGYNAQQVVDEKHGLIVSSDVVNENIDLYQFSSQIEQAAKTLETKPQAACADSGYSDPDELEKVDQQGIKVVVPSMKQAADKPSEPFDKSHFEYHQEMDSYTCPSGKTLTYRNTETDRGRKVYRPDAGVCPACAHFGQCTKSRSGRKVTRMLNEELRQKFERQYEQPDSQAIYRLRKQKVELPFGHIKHNLKAGSFLLRGLPGVQAEMAILSSCFNLARMITLMGVSGLITKLNG